MKALILCVLFSTSVFGWGQNGHRAVGEIAQRHLKVSTKIALKKFMIRESLAEASTWPDEIKSDPSPYFKKLSPWHYMSIRPGTPYDMSENLEKGDVYIAITTLIKDLKTNKKLSKDKKREKVRYLVHLIGDVHQPLHVGNGGDMGGNLCMVRYFGEVYNLHKVWDEKIIDGLKLSFTEIANFVDKKSAKEVRLIQKAPVLEWVKESAALRPSVYPLPVGSNSTDPKDRTYCKSSWAQEMPDDLVPNLGGHAQVSYAYDYKMRPIVKDRILKAGLRLAKVLNDIF